MIGSNVTGLEPVGILGAASVSALGSSAAQCRQALTQGTCQLTVRHDLLLSGDVWVGEYRGELSVSLPPVLAQYASRNLRLALQAYRQIDAVVTAHTASIPRHRLGIVIGTSTSGVSDNEAILATQLASSEPLRLSHTRQAMSATAQALQRCLGWQGPAYTVSTACSSSAKALASAQRLLNAGLLDAVLVGGVDSLASLTINGFACLESLSKTICQPCGAERDGINIGESASFFLLSREKAAVNLVAAGESMDAWHISAPHPEGDGAATAMQRALDAAQLSASDIGYLNLHGTGTPQNDAMEMRAVRRVFGRQSPPLSSTKHQTGHCLGAAGAVEAFIGYRVLCDQQWLPLHCAARLDSELADFDYVRDSALKQPLHYVMSNSFAFGGSNISLILGCR